MYPFARKESDSKPNDFYMDAKIPWDSTQKLYKFIKKVWTNKKTLAATSFKIEESKSPSSLDNFCRRDEKNISIIVALNDGNDDKDDAKTVDLALEKHRQTGTTTPTNGEIRAWSCTGDLSEPCGGEKLFFCWQWIATDIGKGLYATESVQNTITKRTLLLAFYNITDIARMFRQKEHHKGGGQSCNIKEWDL